MKKAFIILYKKKNALNIKKDKKIANPLPLMENIAIVVRKVFMQIKQIIYAMKITKKMIFINVLELTLLENFVWDVKIISI